MNKEKANVKEEKKIEINKEENKKEKRINYFNVFINGLKSNKLYLLSFVITLLFFVISSVSRVKDSEGIFHFNTNNDSNELNNDSGTQSVSATVSDELDVTDYVGIYSREVTFSNSFKLNTCTIDSYKILYQIKKDKSIFKYFYNDCIGTILIWNDELGYASSSGARYINSHDTNYLFGTESVKEVDGYAYKLDNSFTSLKENQKVNDLDISFYDSNIVLSLKDDLFVINGNSVSFHLNEAFENKGGNLDKRVYPKDNEYQFIVFYNNEKKNCYDDVLTDELNYEIYSLKYNSDDKKFNDYVKLVSRNKIDGCSLYKDDLKSLED